MKVITASNIMTNADNESFLEYAIDFTQKAQEQHPYRYNVAEIDNSYSDEHIEVLFFNHEPSFKSDDIIVVTNFRIFSISKVADFTAKNFNINSHSFMDSIRSIEYRKTSIEIQAENEQYIFKSNNSMDQVFVTVNKKIYNRIFDINKKLISARNNATLVTNETASKHDGRRVNDRDSINKRRANEKEIKERRAEERRKIEEKRANENKNSENKIKEESVDDNEPWSPVNKIDNLNRDFFVLCHD